MLATPKEGEHLQKSEGTVHPFSRGGDDGRGGQETRLGDVRPSLSFCVESVNLTDEEARLLAPR